MCALILIFLSAIVIRLHFLSEPVLQDEASNFVRFVVPPFHMGLLSYSDVNNHVFHTFLVRVAYLLLGNKPWVMRLPALAAGILIVPASYFVIRTHYNKDAALLTAGFVAASSLLVRYSMLARGYSLICLFFLLNLGLAKYLKESVNANAWLLFAVLSAFGFLTIPTMLYPFGILIVWLFLSILFQDNGISRGIVLARLFKTLMTVALLTAAFYLPVIIVSGIKPLVANRFIARKSYADFFSDLRPFLRYFWADWNKDLPTVVRLLLVTGFFVSLIFHKRLSRCRIPIVFAVLIWVVPLLLAHPVVPPIRVWLFLLPLYLGLASTGLTYLFGMLQARFGACRRAVFAVFVTAFSLFLGLKVFQTEFIYPPIGTVRDAEQVVLFLKDNLEPGDKVVAPDWRSLVQYYFLLHDVPFDYLNPDYHDANRIWVLAGEYRIRLDASLKYQGTTVSERFQKVFPGYGKTELIKQYRDATIYRIKKKRPSERASERDDIRQ